MSCVSSTWAHNSWMTPWPADSYPISTTVNNGDCWWNHGPFTGCEVDQANHQVISPTWIIFTPVRLPAVCSAPISILKYVAGAGRGIHQCGGYLLFR